MTQENHEKTSVRLVDNGIRTRHLLNASLVRYHLASTYRVLFANINVNKFKQAGSNGSMSASDSAGPGFDPRR